MTTELASKYIKLRPWIPNTPTNLTPLEAENVGLTPTLTTSAFSAETIDGEIHIGSRWLIYDDIGGNNVIYDSGVTLDYLSHIVPLSAGLVGVTTYYWGCSHIGARGGESDRSTLFSFVTLEALDNLFDVRNYTGNGSTQSIVTGLDNVVDKGFMLSLNSTDATSIVRVSTTEFTTFGYHLFYDSTQDLTIDANSLTSWDNDGISFGTEAGFNGSGDTITMMSGVANVAFCDIIAYSGDGTATRALPHILGRDVGLVLVYHLDGVSSTYTIGWLDGYASNEYFWTSNPKSTGNQWGNTLHTDTDIYVGDVTGQFNPNRIGTDYVMLVFPKDSPLDVKVGTYTGDGLSNSPVELGFQPSFIWTFAATGTQTMTFPIAGLDKGKQMSSAAQLTGYFQYIDAITATGFELSNHAGANTDGIVYNFLAMGDPNV